MGHVNEELPRAELFLLRHLFHAQDWRETNALFLAGAKQVSDAPAFDPIAQVLP
jgi:hypothetical protein